MSVANNLLDAIDILAENKVAAVKFDKTVRATITEVVDASIGKYKVKYQNSIFFAYALDLKTYSKGVQVYVVIPSSDFNKDPYITGTVKKSAATATDVITQADRMTIVGTNVIENMFHHVGFCSYKTNDPGTRTIDLSNVVDVDIEGLSLYKQDSEYIQIGATFQTKLSNQQRVGAGNYGIRVRCSYYDARYTNEAKLTEDTITRIYELNVNNMVGNPYSFGVPSEQSVLFEIDSANLRSIDKIEAFCENFPYSNAGTSDTYAGFLNPTDYQFYKNYEKTAEGEVFTNRINFGDKTSFVYDKRTQEWYGYNAETSRYDINKTDIILSNISFQFYDALTEDELNGLFLRITTPYGNYFYKNPTTGEIQPESLTLHGSLRLKGKPVNYKEQDVHFYWFIKDNSITANSSGYSKYGGSGWRCLNTAYVQGAGTSYAPDTYEKQVGTDLCSAKETEFKCVAIFKDGTDTVSADNTIKIYNKSDATNPEVTLMSTMGADFSFNEGQTDIICYIGDKTWGDEGFNPDLYNFYWTAAVDVGNPQTVAADEQNPMKLSNVDVADSYRFVTYECTVKRKTVDEEGNPIEIDFGSAAITLNNGEPNGQYSLVIKNGTQVFQYTKEGVSPTSPTLDEYDRMTLPMLEFDIYNDKGQLLSFGSNEEKVKRMNIRWIWPGSTDPNNLAENETMLKPASDVVFKTYDFPDPTNNSTHRKYVVTKQATLTYGILDIYDLTKYDNNIVLEVDYNNQHLSASTNFTFTKDGEAGTNGTKYLTRIVPRDSTYEKVIIRNENDEYKIQGVSTDANGYKKFTTIGGGSQRTPFKIEIWNGGSSVYKSSINSEDGLSVTWSTSLQDRNERGFLYTNNPQKGYYALDTTKSVADNQTVKATTIDNDKTYHASYPVEIYTNPSYYIEGGYRNCSYESDGTRSAYSQQPFVVKQVSDNSLVEGVWNSSWGGLVSPYHNDSKYTLIEPPNTYQGENIHNYITCKVNNNIVAYIPIEFYLDRYGLAGVSDWDGTSIKLNTTGSNYILSPQIGAGTNDSNGFTGITMGKAMENGKDSVGLFGYHKGQRSIFLDSETGNAEFGKPGASQIKIDATSNEGTIASGNYPSGGMKIKFSNTGSGAELGPYIKYASGHFSVDANGNLTAVGSGRIGSWYITSNNTLANNADITKATVYLNGGATDTAPVFKTPKFQVNADGSFSANNGAFAVTSGGVLTAKSGTIGGWHIGENSIYAMSGNTKTGVALNSDGAIDGAYRSGSTTSHKWNISADGVATFTDVVITNGTTKKTGDDKTKTILNIKNSDNTKAVTINNEGKITANDIDATGGTIGGWTINNSSIVSNDGQTKLYNGGKITLGTGFVLDNSGTGSSSGKSKCANGSSIGAGNVYPGGTGSGGASTDWKDVNVVYSITAATTNDFPSYTDSEGKSCTASGGTKFVYKITYNTRKLHLLVSGETSDASHTA